jgi:hypothetical protein
MEWDPIGVAEVPECADEYDCLISPLMRRLHDQQSERQILTWTGAEMLSHFGMTVDKAETRAFVRRICLWWGHRTGSAIRLSPIGTPATTVERRGK